jgi:hypothetical protein
MECANSGSSSCAFNNINERKVKTASHARQSSFDFYIKVLVELEYYLSFYSICFWILISLKTMSIRGYDAPFGFGAVWIGWQKAKFCRSVLSPLLKPVISRMFIGFVTSKSS